MRNRPTKSHVVLRVFDVVCNKVQLGNKAKALVKAFLESYDVRDILSSRFWDKLAKTGDWDFLEELPKDRRIGLPQGGALSGLLSNLVLDNVDKAIGDLKLNGFLYARYCDDIIMCAMSKEDCEIALDECSTSLEALHLRMYPANPDILYNANYYVAKSKGPFLWGNPSVVGGAISWVSFLGYSIYYDGSTRLRKETLLAHAKSIREECETFLLHAGKFGFRDPSNKPKAVGDFLCRLMAKGTGRINIEPIKGLGRCWLSVFRFVGESKLGLKQMRYLDYVRSSAVARLRRKLEIRKGRLGDNSAEDAKAVLYFGKPFSYYGSCKRVKRKAIAADNELSLCEDVHGDTNVVVAEKDNNTATHPSSNIPESDDISDEKYETSGWGRASGYFG